MARHYGRGAEKYEDNNWRRGYEWSLSYAALQRHATAFWGGEDVDPETGSHHLAAVAFHAFAMMEWGRTHPEMDDRHKPTMREALDRAVRKVMKDGERRFNERVYGSKGYIVDNASAVWPLDFRPNTERTGHDQ